MLIYIQELLICVFSIHLINWHLHRPGLVSLRAWAIEGVTGPLQFESLQAIPSKSLTVFYRSTSRNQYPPEVFAVLVWYRYVLGVPVMPNLSSCLFFLCFFDPKPPNKNRPKLHKTHHKSHQKRHPERRPIWLPACSQLHCKVGCNWSQASLQCIRLFGKPPTCWAKIRRGNPSPGTHPKNLGWLVGWVGWGGQ